MKNDGKVMRKSWENYEKMMRKPWQKKMSFLAGTKNDEKIMRTWWENDEEGMKNPCRNLGSELGVMSFSEYRTPRKSGANVFRVLIPVPGTPVVPRSERGYRSRFWYCRSRRSWTESNYGDLIPIVLPGGGWGRYGWNPSVPTQYFTCGEGGWLGRLGRFGLVPIVVPIFGQRRGSREAGNIQ